MMRILTAALGAPLLGVTLLYGGVAAQAIEEAGPAAAREGAVAVAQAPVPSPAEVLGYELGERFTDVAGLVRYLETLAAASPRVQVRRYGETVEGRPLLQVVIAREDYMARLDEILERNRELSDPSTTAARAQEIAATNPAVVYFSYGVHGNEASSSEAALWTAWDLASGHESVAGVLDSVIVIIDPAVNPDGRDRYVNWFRQAMGLRPNPNPEAWEHWEPWPGGRFNHYLFDLNRDWAWATQPETRARLATWSHWTPQVHVDFHEMDYQSSYFFFPAAKPINPAYPAHILEWAKIFGKANAEAFDRQGWHYYTRESFDLFYPGYGDSWPSLLGAIGMTYEQAGHGRAGLAITRPDGQVLTLRDRAERHRTTGRATLRAAASRKGELLRGFAEFHRRVDEGLPDILLIPGANPDRIEALVSLLYAQGIRVERAERSFRVNAQAHRGFRERREFPAGTLRVPARQPRGRLAITLLQPETVLDATFSYDVSAWSLPYAYGVEAHRAQRVPDAGWRVLEPGVGAVLAATGPSNNNGSAARTAASAEPYGFLVAPSFAAWPGMVKFLDAGGRAVVLEKPFTLAGRAWPAGTFFLPRQGNERLTELVHESGLGDRAVVVSTGLADEGNDLGTGTATELRKVRTALLVGDAISATSFGAHWFFLERTLGLPFDVVPIDRLGAIRIDDYDVLILPDMGRGALDDRTAGLIGDWVRRGGTVVAVAGGARVAAEKLAEIKVRQRESDRDQEAVRARGLRGREARELARWEEQIPGVVLPLTLDPLHPLAFGAGVDGDPERLFVLHRGGLTFEPEDGFETAAYFPAGLERVSGVISQANIKHLEQGSWLAMKRSGRGKYILFADDPVFRHFWYGTFQPYVNALVIGPGL
ncbi:MAG TPA: M14 family metallopeptidase [Longimicrobiales bacterium]|nr:M14 family metallopeptidase [Longimicrobiales bacterium]